jgi:hypothetical protein
VVLLLIVTDPAFQSAAGPRSARYVLAIHVPRHHDGSSSNIGVPLMLVISARWVATARLIFLSLNPCRA